MSRNLNLPFFPLPPEEYNWQYFAETLQSFATYMQNTQNPGEGRYTFMVLTNLQTDEIGLEEGAVFSHEGQLRTPVPHSSYVRGVEAATGEVGAVRVRIR